MTKTINNWDVIPTMSDKRLKLFTVPGTKRKLRLRADVGGYLVAFIASIGLAGEWLQTSYNSTFRSTYAGIGFTYDVDADEFVAPAAPEVEAPIEP